MLTIFADALLIAARLSPPNTPPRERPHDAEGDKAFRRFWLNYAAVNR